MPLRLTGRASQGGARFVFDEQRTPPDRRRVSIVITFESDDRWLLEVHDVGSRQVVAGYRFNRSAR